MYVGGGHSGDFALFDPTRPYAIAFQEAGTFEHVIYQVPRASLDARRSVRQPHRLFAHDGTGFGTWVREQRLRRCRDDLASQQLSGSAIAEIATRWGFRSPAHFTRAFHARYGITRPNSAAPPATSAAGS